MQYEGVRQQIVAAMTDTTHPHHLYELIQPLQPYDMSEVIREMEHDQVLTLIMKLPIAFAAESLEHLEPDLQYKIIHHLEQKMAPALLKQLSSDTIVDMLLAIHPLQAEKVLTLLPADYRKKIDDLMTYPEETAGSLTTVDYISARAHWTGEQALRHIRKVGHEAEIVSYIYVTNIRGELVGIVSLKEIILASPDTSLSNLTTTDIISVPAEMGQEEVAQIFSNYDLYALPVVNQQKRLIGIITIDDVVDVIQEEATEDVQKLGGSQPLTEPYFRTSVWKLYSSRIIWLLVLFVGGAYTANVLSSYQGEIQKVIILSVFIPLLIGTGGNTGSQIVSTLVRAVGIGEVAFGDMLRVVKKELMTGLLLGLSLGIIAYFRAMTMKVSIQVGCVVSLSAMLIVLWATFVAAILPLILHRLRIDPAVVSGPLITTLVDGTGLVIYFSIAKMILHI
ncbi:magnesium transporter [Seinonella peptonophila]|uniref:Magnesium transporter MgtE n=1 Tax=Seinonella peptonophila TaxID=112248 RepID=A0A1M4W5X7_9BACL|nr:magnesium transporter [Seinonella peptonophila]SHE76382.1 magnesium transporter [Seinonella peptonophila]